MKDKAKNKLKRSLAGLLALMMSTSMLPDMVAIADEKPANYPYVLFAADDQGGISVNAGGFTVNGDICTNGELAKAVHWGNFNGREFINENTSDEVISDDETTAGETTEFDFKKDMIFINQKLMNTYFSENTAKYEVSKSFVEMNINVSQPTFVTGKLGFEGNVNLNNPVGAVSDIDFNSETINGNNTATFNNS